MDPTPNHTEADWSVRGYSLGPRCCSRAISVFRQGLSNAKVRKQESLTPLSVAVFPNTSQSLMRSDVSALNALTRYTRALLSAVGFFGPMGVLGSQQSPEPQREVRFDINSDGRPVTRAEVIVQERSLGVVRARTQANGGRASIRLSTDYRDLIVTVRALGFERTSFGIRLDTLKATVAVSLRASVTQLGRLAIRSRRLPPPSVYEFDPRPFVELVQYDASLEAGAVDRINASAALASLAGTVRGGDGIADVQYLGIAGEQNGNVFAGLVGGPARLPAAASAIRRVEQSTVDVTAGGVSGLRLNTFLIPGSSTSVGNGTIAFDNAVSRHTASGPSANRAVVGSVARSGRLPRAPWTFNSAIEGTLAENATVRADASQPLALGNEENDEVYRQFGSVSASVVTRIDRLPSAKSTTSVNVAGSIQQNARQPLGGLGTLPSQANQSVGGALEYSRKALSGVARAKLLAEKSRSTLSGDGAQSVSLLILDAGTGLASRQYWGSLFPDRQVLDRVGATGQLAYESALGAGNLHVVKALFEVTANQSTNWQQSIDGGLLRLRGIRGAPHLDTLGSTIRTGSGSVRLESGQAVVGLGHTWSMSARTKLQSSLRLSVERTRGVASHRSLGSALFNDVEPRVGVTQTIGTAKSRVGAPVGSGTWQLTGMLTRMKGRVPTEVLASILTDPRNGIEVTECSGGSPVAWNQSAELSENCARFSSRQSYAPSLLTPRYRAPVANRAHLVAKWMEAPLNSEITFEALGTFQQYDRSISLLQQQQPVFTTAEGRPSYVEANSVGSNTGLIATPSPSFLGEGVAVSSDGKTRAGRLAVTVRPFDFLSTRMAWSLTYARQYSETYKTDFESSTAGDPYRVSWRRNGQVPRNTIQGYARFRISSAVEIVGGLSAQFGTRFTPLVGADINGDGRANDRANARIARSLAGAASSPALERRIRECVDRAEIAEEMQCSGPVQVQSNLEARVQLPRTRARGSVLVLSLTNPLSLLGQLFGHQGTGSTVAQIDQVLLQPVRFDRATGSYAYQLNTNFGRPLPGAFASWLAPRVNVQISVPLAQTPVEQLAERIRSPADYSSLKGKWVQMALPTSVHVLAAFADSLLLTQEQRTEILPRVEAHSRLRDSLIATLERSRSRGAFREVNDAIGRDLIGLCQLILRTLTKDQVASITPALRRLLSDSEVSAAMRRGAVVW